MCDKTQVRMAVAAERSARASNWLLVAACFGIGLTVFTISSSFKKMHLQRQQAFDRATLQLRPYLNIKHLEYKGTFDFLSYDEGESDNNTPLSLREVEDGSPMWNGVRVFRHQLSRKLLFSNSGDTPLRLTRWISSTMSEDEWMRKYNQNDSMLTESIRDFSEWQVPQGNIPILPEGEALEFASITRSMPKAVFKRCANQGLLCLYPYTYAVYEDCFGRAHFTLVIEKLTFELSLVNNRYEVSKQPQGEIVLYRWDLPVSAAN